MNRRLLHLILVGVCLAFSVPGAALSMTPPNGCTVSDCASLLALSVGLHPAKRQRTAAFRDAPAPRRADLASRAQAAIRDAARLSMNLCSARGQFLRPNRHSGTRGQAARAPACGLWSAGATPESWRLAMARSAEAPAGGPQKANIILIMADDLGYETVGANGGTSYLTPVLDRLASTGARFTHCYAQPLCTPTRVQLMTGLSNARNYVRFGTIDPQAITFAHLLKATGYATCIAGKWQLGRDPDLPKRLGFDESCLWQHLRRPPRYANPGLEINGVPKDFANGEYGPDLVNDYALDFITRNRDRPFFLYYPMILTHAPYQPTPDSKTWNPKALGEEVNRAKEHFADMVTYLDKLIGRLVTSLEAQGLRNHTLILFTGDNGTGRGTRSRMGDREVIGGKGLTTTAGMHVPLIANWPGRVVSGTVCSDLVDSTDFLPTMLEAAGVKPPSGLPIDGRSFLPQLKGERGQPREWVYSWYSPRQGTDMNVREFAFNQRYKLYRTGEFFDLGKDLTEAHPLQVGSLKGDAATAARTLQAALDRFRGARPAALDRAIGDSTGGKGSQENTNNE